MENIQYNDRLITINYQPIEVGDLIYDKNSDVIYTATITDADDIGWVVVSTDCQ